MLKSMDSFLNYSTHWHWIARAIFTTQTPILTFNLIMEALLCLLIQLEGIKVYLYLSTYWELVLPSKNASKEVTTITNK